MGRRSAPRGNRPTATTALLLARAPRGSWVRPAVQGSPNWSRPASDPPLCGRALVQPRWRRAPNLRREGPQSPVKPRWDGRAAPRTPGDTAGRNLFFWLEVSQGPFFAFWPHCIFFLKVRYLKNATPGGLQTTMVGFLAPPGCARASCRPANFYRFRTREHARRPCRGGTWSPGVPSFFIIFLPH